MPNRSTPLAKPCPAMVESVSGGVMSRIVDGGGILSVVGEWVDEGGSWVVGFVSEWRFNQGDRGSLCR